MKALALPFFLLAISSLLLCCSSDTDVSMAINFCESYEADKNCQDSGNTFELGTPVFVHFTSDTPFKEDTITGRIIRIAEDGELYELGMKQFNLESETTYLTQSIPFQNFGHDALGTFLIKFSDTNDQVLAERELIIIE